jgi:hypothetical protein
MRKLGEIVRMATRNTDVQFGQRWVPRNESDRRLTELIAMKRLKMRKAHNDI